MSIEIAKEVLQIEESGLAAVRERIGEEFVQAVEIILASPGRLVITGIGKSGIVAKRYPQHLTVPGRPRFSSIRWRRCTAIWEW